jgi:hypothetical protein
MVDLDHARLPLHSDERVNDSKFIFVLLLPFYSYLKILVRNGVKGPKLIPFWCLMPKWEKIRPKQEMDQLPLENFENSRVRVCVCQFVPYLLRGEGLIMGKRGVLESLINFSCNISLYVSTSVFDLEIGN